MKAIINRTAEFGTLNGVLKKNDEIRTVVAAHLKQGSAKLLIDTDETLMYELDDEPQPEPEQEHVENILKASNMMTVHGVIYEDIFFKYMLLFKKEQREFFKSENRVQAINAVYGERMLKERQELFEHVNPRMKHTLMYREIKQDLYGN